jgi:hypothetical protein
LQSEIRIKATVNTWLSHLKNGNGLNVIAHGGMPKDIFDDDMEWIDQMYPLLFPYGLTGPSADRSIPIKLEDWIKHVLQFKDDRFRKHHDFIFTIYNIIQRRRVNAATRYII